MDDFDLLVPPGEEEYEEQEKIEFERGFATATEKMR